MSARKLCNELFGDKADRTNFHFWPLCRVFVTLPGVPADAVSMRVVYTVVIQSVQVGGMAPLVPPGAFACDSTFAPLNTVIIPVLRSKRHSTVIRRRISSGTCEHNRGVDSYSYHFLGCSFQYFQNNSTFL